MTTIFRIFSINTRHGMAVGLLLATLMAACGSGDDGSSGATSNDSPKNTEVQSSPPMASNQGSTSSAKQESASPGNSASSPVTVKNNTATVEITGNDRMQYNINEFTVPAGSTVRIKFVNVGDLPKNAMGHNVVVMKKDVDLQPFVAAAAQAGQNDYFPPDRSDAVIAHTEMLGPDQSDTMTFEAPAPGDYPYLCSFPGHFAAGMRGVMTVE